MWRAILGSFAKGTENSISNELFERNINEQSINFTIMHFGAGDKSGLVCYGEISMISGLQEVQIFWLDLKHFGLLQ